MSGSAYERRRELGFKERMDDIQICELLHMIGNHIFTGSVEDLRKARNMLNTYLEQNS